MSSVMVNLCVNLAGSQRPDTSLNIITDVSVWVFLDEIS